MGGFKDSKKHTGKGLPCNSYMPAGSKGRSNEERCCENDCYIRGEQSEFLVTRLFGLVMLRVHKRYHIRASGKKIAVCETSEQKSPIE